MRAVAERVRVREPSLYRHVADRRDLLRAVEESVVAELRGVLEGGAGAEDDRVALGEIADAYREFARESPEQYALILRCRVGIPRRRRHGGRRWNRHCGGCSVGCGTRALRLCGPGC